MPSRGRGIRISKICCGNGSSAAFVSGVLLPSWSQALNPLPLNLTAISLAMVAAVAATTGAITGAIFARAMIGGLAVPWSRSALATPRVTVRHRPDDAAELFCQVVSHSIIGTARYHYLCLIRFHLGLCPGPREHYKSGSIVNRIL